MTDKQEFGSLLRKARKAARFATIRESADFLSTHGIEYTDEAIGHWENGRRVPNREMLVDVLRLLAEWAGVANPEQANRILRHAGYNLLFDEERRTLFPRLVAPIANLPEKLHRTLVDRDDAVSAVIGILSDPRAKPLVVLSGLGGIGKTALAVDVVTNLMIAGMFSKLAWVTAKIEELPGTRIRQIRDQPPNWRIVLLSFADQLGLVISQRASTEVLEGQLRDMLSQETRLVVLDNLETLKSAQDVARSLHRLVSPGTVSRVLITSRESLCEESYVVDYPLTGLSERATHDLIALEAEERGADTLLAANRALVKRIYTVTEGMPLALKLIVSQYLAGIALDEELDRLQGAREQELYRFIYLALWEKLSIPAQKILAGAAAFGSSALRSMLIEVSMVTEDVFTETIPELVRYSLIDILRHPEIDRQRYAIHAMTRWFVNSPLSEMWKQQKATNPTDL